MSDTVPHLVIVESPAKAKTINKYLGKEYRVTACNGHIKDLPRSRMGIDVDKDFEPKYITITGKGKILAELKSMAKAADKIFLATDPDREGETISFHLQQALKKKKREIYRITFNEITAEALRHAIKKPAPVNLNLVEAGITRRLLDRLVGYELSPLLWRKVMPGLSAGRVQSVALRLICEREKEHQAFTIEEYWKLGLVALNHHRQVKFLLCDETFKEQHLANAVDCERVVAASTDAKLTVVNIDKRQKRKNPLPPFITSTLQQEASKKLKYTAKKTMMLAQKLYEGMDIGEETVGLITYMRTDSVRVNDKAITAARKKIASLFGKEYVPEQPNVYKSKKAIQDAHEAIRPTDLSLIPDKVEKYLDKDHFKLYRMIYFRFLESQMREALIEQTTVQAVCAGNNFKASGSVIKFDGFLKCWEDDEDEDDANTLPEFTPGESYKVKAFEPEQCFTQPPPRYNEASLIKVLEENGVGRPSTYAVIISTIQERRYVKKDKGRFLPTELGVIINNLLTEHFPEIVDVEFTAKLEDQLDGIEEGTATRLALLKEFYGIFKNDIDRALEKMPELKQEMEKITEFKCDKCEAFMMVKWGRYGKFLACSKFPDCRNVKSMIENPDGTIEMEKEEAIDGQCPKCGKGLIYKRSRFGRFIACSGYPECRYTQSEKFGIKCPAKDCPGDIVVISSRRGKMYGCSRYPDCGFRSYFTPMERKCGACGGPVMVEKETKRDGRIFECVNPACKHKEPRPEPTVEATDQITE